MKQSIQFWLTSGIAMCGLVATSPAFAQIAPDGTVSTNVKTTDNRNFTITDGNRAGKNLFHSFSEFSVPTGGSVFFNNAADIQNIISRVTGSSISNIDGLIRANSAANLFLLNPNGIIFGRNASLNIGGSFLASTASSLKFADGTQFSATAPQTTPLLTISVPIGLQFGPKAGGIRVQGPGAVRDPDSGRLRNPEAGLFVLPERTLALVGSSVALEGGILTTTGGRIELGSVASPSLVSLTPIDKGWSLGYEGVQNFRDIRLSQGAAVDASGLGGGDIQVQGRQVKLIDGSEIEASTLGSEAGGTLAVSASESVELTGTSANDDPSALSAQVYEGATGAGGNLTVKTGRLILHDGAQVSASTFGQGQGGNLSVTASDSVELLGGSAQDLTGLFARTYYGGGAAGNLTIATGKLMVRDGAQVAANTFGQGQAGNLSVTASDSVELLGGSAQDPSGLFTQTTGAGAAGELRITTGNLLVQDGARVSATTDGQGNGGNIQVNATNSVNLFGVSPDGTSSGLFTSTSAMGQGGSITVNSSTFRLADGAVVSALTTDEGKGGNITVNANTFEADNGGQVLTTTSSSGHAGNISLNVPNSVTLSGSDRTYADRLALLGPNAINNEGAASGLFANTASDSTGNGGSISIDPIKLTLTDGARVAVDSQGKGSAGNLLIQAGSVTLDRGASLSAATASGEGGKITLNAQDLLLMRHNSNISAEASGTGNGGNITINTPFIVAVPTEDSDIIASAMNGRGGNIDITASGIFGIQRRNQHTLQSYIDASSQLGINGTVQINTLGIDPSRGLVNLPVQPVNVTGLIAQGCPADVGPRASIFVVTGRGGLPPTPREALSSEPALADLGTTVQGQENHASAATSTNPTSSEPAQILEATGWVTNAKGEVVLIAQPPTVTPDIPWLTPTTCHGS